MTAAALSIDRGARIGDAAVVMRGRQSFVGRSAELSELRGAVNEARAGRGGVWLITGEAGIGKSRLAEEVAREAAAAGARAVWGRCWEAGGAPAYWPWIQLLRGVLRDAAPDVVTPARAAQLAQLLPELGDAVTAPLSPARARFELLDAVAGALCDAARAAPLILCIEDLHAADASSLLLLDFVGRQLRAARVAVLGTYREVEAHAAEHGDLLLRIAQEAQTLALRRLGHAEVRQLLATLAGEPPAPRWSTRASNAPKGTRCSWSSSRDCSSPVAWSHPRPCARSPCPAASARPSART